MLHRSILRALVVALLATLALVPAGAASSKPPQPGGEPAPACWSPGSAFSIGTHNVLHGTATFTRFAAVIGWQEVTRPVHRTKMKNQLGSGYRHYIPLVDSAAAIPVSWHADRFAFLAGHSIKTHEGRIGITPDRWISVVHLRRRSNGQRYVFVNTHFISEAFKEGSSYRTWRLERWQEHYRKLHAVLGGIRANHPHAPIWLVGDFNHSGYLNFDALRLSPLRLENRLPIDQMYAGLPGRGGCVAKLSPMGSDHDRWFARAWTA